MFNDKIEIFREIIKLAEELNSTRDNEIIALDCVAAHDKVMKKGKASEKVFKKIKEYLDTLSREDINMLFGIMLLGRSDAYSIDSVKSSINNKTFIHDRECEVNKISTNMLLLTQIKCGLDRLNIVVI